MQLIGGILAVPFIDHAKDLRTHLPEIGSAQIAPEERHDAGADFLGKSDAVEVAIGFEAVDEHLVRDGEHCDEHCHDDDELK